MGGWIGVLRPACVFQHPLDEKLNQDDEYLDDPDFERFEVVGSVMEGFSVLVTVCGETTGIWRSLSTNEITRETGAGPVHSIYVISTIDPEMYVERLTDEGADEGCSLAPNWPRS